jgi:hypothetical protein
MMAEGLDETDDKEVLSEQKKGDKSLLQNKEALENNNNIKIKEDQ